MTTPLVNSPSKLWLPAVAALALALTACRGNPSPAASPAISVSHQVTGTVAYGHPVAGQTVVAVDSAGKTCATAVTANDGTYSMGTNGCAPGSVALSVQGYTTPKGVSLLSVAVPPAGQSIIDGVVNIDPLTTLLAYDLAGVVSSSTPPADSADVLALLPQVTAAQVQQATKNILTVSLLTDLQKNYNVAATGLSLTSTPFTANGQGLDAFFDAYTLTAPSAGSVQIASAASGLTVSVALPHAAGSPSVVTSSMSYTVGGSVAGLSGGSVTLLLNGSSPLTIAASGGFTFPATASTTYSVTVEKQPAGQTCSVSNGSGAGITADVTNIGVTCSVDNYGISGTVSGLASGAQVVLSDNGTDPTTVGTNGNFSFSAPVAYDGSYAVVVTTQPTGQICTVSNASGSNVTTTVANVAVVCSTATYLIGGTVTGLSSGSAVTLEDNGGDALTVTADGAFTFSTPVAFAGSYSVTVATQPAGGNCTVTNGTGANVAATVSNVQITCTIDQFAYIYVPNYGSNNVLGYRHDFTTGATTAIPGSPFASGANDRWVAANAAGTFLYVTNETDNTISAYTIDSATGALTEVAGSPYATGTTPVSVTLNPAGTFAYVANSNSGTVSAYSINQTSGALTPVPGSPFAAGAIPTKIAVNPAGTFAYVTNQNNAAVIGFSIDQTTGALTEIAGSPFSVGTGNSPEGITVNPTGTVLYVANWQANVAAFSIDPGTGALTAVAGSPFAAGTSWGWQSVAINPAGTFAYVGAGNGSPLLTFSVDPTTGALTQLTGESYGADGWNYTVFNSTGSTAIISNALNLTIGVTDVNATTGQLTDQPGSPFSVGARPFDIAVVQP